VDETVDPAFGARSRAGEASSAVARDDREAHRRHISVADVLVVVAVLLGVAATLFVLYEIRRVIVWLLVAGFFATVLAPLVTRIERRGVRRGLAVTIVTVGLAIVLGAILFAFAKPLVSQAVEFATHLHANVEKLKQLPLVRDVVERFNIQGSVGNVSSSLPQQLVGFSGPLFAAFASIGQAVVGLISIVVLTIFFLLYGPSLVGLARDAIGSRRHRERAERLGQRSMQAVSGWVLGNLVTSIVASVASLIVFAILGLPYAFLLALWVGVADLIPLVGATLGAIPAVIVAFLHSTTAGIVTLAFFILYQQFENHVLQPLVYGRTIRLNPFLVLLAVLIGVELAGFLGALLALPLAGIAQVALDEFVPHGVTLGEPDADEEPASDPA
jgi:predicted PurR-regulated permease PerM